eukprot:g12622.t2
MLGDGDTLASRQITDGTAVHLFQRPKTSVTAAAGPGGVVSTAQHPGRLHEFPPVLLQVQGARAGGGSGATGYMNSHWEVDGPRKQIRFLASFLLLISLLECLASVSAAMSYSGAPGNGGESGGGDGGPYTELPDEYWVLIKGRIISSLMGIVVGVLGIRGSQSLNTQTIKMYFVGLVMCAIVAMAIRIEVLVDIISGKIPFGDYGMASPNSSDDYSGGGGGAGGAGSGPGSGGPGDEGRHHETAEEAESSLFFTAFSAFVSVVVSGGVWLVCIRRKRGRQKESLEQNTGHTAPTRHTITMKIFAAFTLALVASDLGSAFTVPLATRSATSVARSSSSVCMSVGDEGMTRKDAIAAFSAGAGALLGAATVPAAAFAAEEAAAPTEAPVASDGPPTDWGLTKQYYPDAAKMVRHMRYCTNMEKGDPNMADIAMNCKKEMVEFVSNYRRSDKINGKLSYSNLYTSISVLAGHYASYGPKFPVPEKRRKRLLQEYTDIERAIKRQR